MKKKLVSIMLAAAMVVSLVACGGTGDSSKSSTPTSSVEESASASVGESEDVAGGTEIGTYPIVEEPITIRAAYIGSENAANRDAGRIVWNKLAEITGINIEWEFIENEARATYLASGDWPDLFLDSSQLGGNAVVNDYGVVGGKFLNIFDYLEYMPNLQKTFEDYPIAKAAITEINGEAYGFPTVEDSATVVSVRTQIRTDVLEENGVKVPTTVDEFYEALKTLKEKTGIVHWVPDLTNDESYWAPMIYAAFGTETNMNFDDDGTGKVIFNRTSEQMRLYLEFMNKLYEEGLIHQEFLTMDKTVQKEASIPCAFLDNGGSGFQESDFADGQFHIDGIEPLTSEYDSTQEILGVSNFRYKRVFVNADTEYAEEICRMLDVTYASEEVVEGSGLSGMSFCYGIEGVDWYKNDDGKTYELVAPESYDGVFSTYQYDELVWQNTGRIDALAGLVSSTPGNSAERQKAYVKGVHPFMSDNYFPVNMLKFTDEEQRVIDNKLADIKTYYKEMEGKFITGAADIETEWKTYCDTLEQMGVEDVIAAYQSSYDRWLEAVK